MKDYANIKIHTQMLIAALFVMASKWKPHRCFRWVSGWTSFGPSTPQNTSRCWSGTNYGRTRKSAQMSKGLCWVKKPIAKGHTFYNSTYITLLIWQNNRNDKQVSGDTDQGWKRELGREGSVCSEKQQEGLCGEGNVLVLPASVWTAWWW